MTFLEKYKQDHPEELIPPDCTPIDCPHRYGYEEEFNCSSIDCDDCWDREISEESESLKAVEIGEAASEGLDKGMDETYSLEEIKEMLGINDEDVSKVLDMVEAKEKAHAKMWREYKAEQLQPIKEAINNYHNSIKDSGDRTEFATGAVRDMHEGKGRCDLLPLDVVGHILANPTFTYIYLFQENGDTRNLEQALTISGVFHDAYTYYLETAIHFEDGAKKYGEYNWQKGIPVNCYIDSAVRHYLKYLRGDEDERHDRAFVWNILCCIWTCKHKPELNCYLKKESEGE